MRYVLTLVVAMSCIASARAMTQSGSSRGAGSEGVRACALLTKDLVAPFTENKKILDVLPPEEEVLQPSGTACEYGAVRLQVFPGRGGKRTISGADYEPITGVGDGGYFRSNRNRYAELTIWTSKHSLDLQVSVPSGRTAESMKADVMALARTLLAKLP